MSQSKVEQDGDCGIANVELLGGYPPPSVAFPLLAELALKGVMVISNPNLGRKA